MRKRISISVLTMLSICLMNLQFLYAYQLEIPGKDLVRSNGMFYVQISGPLGIQTLQVNAHSNCKSYEDINKEKTSISLSQQLISLDYYNLRLLNSSAETLEDDRGNYTVMSLKFSYKRLAHTIITNTYYDKNDAARARLNFNKYAPLNDAGSSLRYDHDPNEHIEQFEVSVNLGQIGIKTANQQFTSGTTLGFTQGYNQYSIKYNGSNIQDSVVNCGSYITSLPTPSISNYHFDGWYQNGNRINSVYVCESNVTLDANYTPINYSITYNYNGGRGNNPTSYNVESNDFKLNDPAKEKHEFIGWIGSCGNTPIKDVVIKRGSSGHKSYRAVYKRIYAPPIIVASDRYFFVGDDVNQEELLKRVKAIDDDDINITKDIKIQSISYNNHIVDHPDRLDTSKVGNYDLTFTVSDIRGLKTSKTIKIYVVSSMVDLTSNQYRFINENHLDTIDNNSCWKDQELYQLLTNSLSKTKPIKEYEIRGFK